MTNENRKLRVILSLGILIAALGPSAGAESAETTSAAGTEVRHRMKSPKEKASYGIGVEMVRNFQRQGMDVDLDLVILGMQEAASGGKLMMKDDEMMRTLTAFASEARAKQAQARLMAAQDNKKEGEEFLAANKAKEGVIVLKSGLQYRILKQGTGRNPEEDDTVEYRYRGLLINGNEFDNSERTGDSASISLSDINVIPGLREGLKMMPVGSKWQFFIPPQLGYGSRGSGAIGPYAAIIYEVELLSAAKDSAEKRPLPQEETSSKM